MGNFAIKLIRYKDSFILNICDEKLLSKTLIQGELKLFIDPRYYGNLLVNKMELGSYLNNTNIINIAGKEAVETVLGYGFGNKEAVKIIDGVPFLLIYKFNY